jgi:hypothetical protein
VSVVAADEAVDQGGDRGVAYAALPRAFRWILAFPHSPFWLGAAAGAAYVLLAGATALAATGTTRWFAGGGTMELSYALWFAWVPIAVALLVRGVERDVLELAPTLGVEPSGRAALLQEALSVPVRAIAIGATVGLLMTGAALGLGLGMTDPSPTGAARIFVAVREVTIELAVFCVLGWGVGAALRLSWLTAERARLNLLECNVFSPLVRNGLRLALLWLIVNAISIPVVLAPPAVFSVRAAQTGMALTLVLGFCAIGALLISTQGARSATRAAKGDELTRVRAQIAEARQTRDDVRLPGLLAWESRVESVPEWPIDAAALRRIALYLLIPLGSWVGGALVERLVDALLR